MRINRRWTDEEIKFMNENYNKLPNKKIAKVLGRSVRAIQNQACLLGVTEPHRRSKRIPAIEQFIEETRKLDNAKKEETTEFIMFTLLIATLIASIVNIVITIIGG